MRITLSIPDAVAERFQRAVPSQQRSRLVTRLLEEELARRDAALAEACEAANADQTLEAEIDAWQSFEDPVE